MPLPNGLIVGTQRAGTTWLYEYLTLCPDVSSTQGVKETFFFDRRFEKGVEWYASHFLDTRIRIEVAPTYFHSVEAIERIRQVLGEIRLACILRDPVERSLSLYHHYLRMGTVAGTLEQAIDMRPDIVESSRYSKYLPLWLEAFGPDTLKVFLYEDLRDSKEEFSRAVAAHFRFTAPPIPESLRDPINPTTTAPSHRLARLSTAIADRLRERRVYWPINVLKALGLRSVIYGRSSDSRDLGTDGEILRDALAGETRRLEDILGLHLPQWQTA